MTPGRWLALVVLLLALAFGLMGGEYSVLDQHTLRREAREEADSVQVLGRVVDSLAAELKAIQTDPAVQERIAREKWGMVRDGEFVFRIDREGPATTPP